MNKISSLLAVFFVAFSLSADDSAIDQKGLGNDALLKQFVQSKGTGIISFDTSNIKQFWIDKSVVSKNKSFDIILKESNNDSSKESIPLKIQLINVNGSQDCKIEVISETRDFGFTVLDNDLTVLSSSQIDDSFLDYSVVSSVFHLEDTKTMSFYLKFNSITHSILSIKDIIMSFSQTTQKGLFASQGIIKHNKNNITTSSQVSENASGISVTGKRSVILSSKKLPVSNTVFASSVSVKNTGECATTVYIGYAVYTKDEIKLDKRNFPYKSDSNVLKVVSSEEGSNKLFGK